MEISRDWATSGATEILMDFKGSVGVHENTANLINQRQCIHIIEIDTALRATLARKIFNLGHHAEIYGSIAELVACRPQGGIILVRQSGAEVSIDRLVAEMADHGLWIPIIAHAPNPGPAMVVAAMKAGAIDFISDPGDEAELRDAIRRTAAEASGMIARRSKQVDASRRISTLSTRENQVLTLLAGGHSNKEMARLLDISPRTVEIHRMKMMGKIGAHNVADAIAAFLSVQIFGRETGLCQ